MPARVVPVSPFDLVVFGGTGDLARRKLLPALYYRDLAGQLPEDARIIGVARSELSAEAYRGRALEALRSFIPATDLDDACLRRFIGRINYARVDVSSADGWGALVAALKGREDCVRPFYLAVELGFFGPGCERPMASGLLAPTARLVAEKPLADQLASYRDLNAQLTHAFDEHHLYRIDHYLGKETVQNLMALRFANALFEPLWNARHVDHMQITVAESVGIEGRGAYYDHAGALRDMVQNHLLQLLCLTAMEPPANFDPNDVRSEKLKVLHALEPINASNVESRVVRGQYAERNGGASYLEDAGIDASMTETFVALKVHIANWRWSDTPFYLRTGKRLRSRLSEIAVAFKDVPHSIFPATVGVMHQNTLVMRLQPHGGITLGMTIKDPGPGGMRLIQAPLDMTFADSLGIKDLRMPDAYERLVMDVIRGDQTLFMRGDEVEAAWAWIDPILAAWDAAPRPPQLYDAGSSGPEDALRLMHIDGRRWLEIEA